MAGPYDTAAEEGNLEEIEAQEEEEEEEEGLDDFDDSVFDGPDDLGDKPVQEEEEDEAPYRP